MQQRENTMMQQHPWTWKELVLLLALAFVLVPPLIENFLHDRLEEWFQNDLYSGTLTGLIMAIVFTAGVYGIAIKPKGLGWQEVGFRKFRPSYWGRIAMWYVILVIGAVALSYVVELLFDLGTTNSKTDSLTSRLTPVNMLIAFLSAAVVSPVYEEIFYRGFVYRWIRCKYGIYAGLIASALIFMFAHWPTYNQLPYALFCGIIFALTYEKTSSIYPAMILHGLFNGTVFLLTVLG
jgi:hypothetical protein